MSSETRSPQIDRRYLEELEHELKREPGVSPEEALVDAREFLGAAAAELVQSGEAPDGEALYREMIRTFGDPAEVAAAYAAGARPDPLQGYAPGWRICCTRCGRSAPLARVGGTRSGARSLHKYTLGFCQDCGRISLFPHPARYGCNQPDEATGRAGDRGRCAALHAPSLAGVAGDCRRHCRAHVYYFSSCDVRTLAARGETGKCPGGRFCPRFELFALRDVVPERPPASRSEQVGKRILNLREAKLEALLAQAP